MLVPKLGNDFHCPPSSFNEAVTAKGTPPKAEI